MYSPNFIAQIARNRIKQNKNFILAVCGQTGSGKSFIALRLGEDIDPDFNIKNVFFNPEAIFSILATDRPKPGTVLVFDEAGLGIGARDWQSQLNKDTSKLLQLFRFENLILIMTVPGLGFIDSQARKLVHAYVEPKRIDYKNETCWYSYHNFQYNPRLDKIYYHRYMDIDFHRIGKPSQSLIDEYEAKKRDFANRFYRKANNKFGEKEKVLGIMKEIMKMKIFEKDKVKLFIERTGMSQRSYFNYKKEVT
jgi:hypothetical protein